MSADDDLKPEIRRELARFDQEVCDLEEVLDVQVRTLRRMVEALKRETVGDTTVAAKGRAVSDGAVKKAKELTLSLVAAAQAQAQLERTAASRQARMTPQERLAALQRLVLKLPYPDRRAFATALLEAHNARRREAVAAGLETADPTLVASFLELA